MQFNESLFLYPGQLVVTKDAMQISTILGSCVSICFFDSIRCIAGMNHYILPVNDKFRANIEKYGDTSMKFMLNKMLSMGSNSGDIVASLFGGGELITNRNSGFNIGKKNIEVALDFLCHHEIKILCMEVGGLLGRKITFNTLTGTVTHTSMGSLK